MARLTEEDRLELLPQIARRYSEGEDIDKLSAEYKIPVRTLYYHFRRMGIHRPRRRGYPTAESVVRETEVKALSDEAEKLATIAVGIGGVIARRYTPLIDNLLSQGKTLEYIAEDFMSWYEMKTATEARIKNLETEIHDLNRKLSEAYAMAHPNFRYMLRAQLLNKYALQVLRAKALGVRIPVRPTLNAFQKDLLELEKDLEEVFK